MDCVPGIRAVILDLDGTLLDTAPEIVLAMDRTLDELGLPHLAAREIEAMIGKGVPKLVERALERVGARDVDHAAAVLTFESQYQQTVGTMTVPYPGATLGLELMDEQGLALAVVTNKPRFFTKQLLDRAGIAQLFRAIIAGDDGVAKKPAPDMLLAACKAMGTEPAQTLMLGDSDNDVLAARAAGCPVWCVPYGYNEGRQPETLACDRLVDSIEEAARVLARAV
jgi:phosphoglycolate phosphatase